MQRQDIVSVVQCIGVEAEHHVIGHRNCILFRGDRIEHRCSIELGDGGQHCVGRLVAGRRIDILKHLWRLGQRPLRCTGVIAVGQFEADGIETGERRRAFVSGRDRFGFGVERRQLPLRDIRRRCAGRGKDQCCLGIFLRWQWRGTSIQRAGGHDACGAQRAEHQAVVGTLGADVAGGGSKVKSGSGTGTSPARAQQAAPAPRCARAAAARPQRNRLAFNRQQCRRFRCGGVAFGQRPVAQCLEAAAGDFENILAARAAVAQGFQVVLQAGHGIGQGVQLAAAGTRWRPISSASMYCCTPRR